MAVGLVLSLGLASGILLLELTTDPIELWSNPDSVTRRNKEYYDSHFEPFYRTEQIIMYPKEKEFIYDLGAMNATIRMGPVFKKEFLLEVHKLEEAIKNVRII